MAPGMAVRMVVMALLCTPVLGVSVARAELPGLGKPASSPPKGSDGQLRASRRPVAVIDLTNDQAVRDLAIRLLDTLASHPELAPPAISDGAALVDKLPAVEELRITEAQKKRRAAEANLAQRNFREAAIDAVEGQELLLHVAPRAAIALYADLALALGQSRLGEKKDAEAREAFALTYRLDPQRTLDDLHYLPEVIQAFEAAKQAAPGVGTLMVHGGGRVWIDGEERGPSPGEFQVPFGRHVVWLTGPLRETGGKEVLVTATQPGNATIVDGPLTRPQKVVRFRIALSQAQDPAARANAMKDLASFVNVHDAVLLSEVNGKIIWQTWRDRAPGFSAFREYRSDRPLEIVQQLAPVLPIEEPEPPTVSVPVVEKRWYQRPSVQLGSVATVMVAIVVGYFWAHYNEPPRPWDTNITVPPAGK